MKKSSKAGSRHGGEGGRGKYTSITNSEPLVKSTSEEDFSNRESSASNASPAYLSDRSSTTGNNQYSVASDSSSPLAMSPWNNNTSSSPWNTNPFADDAEGGGTVDSAATTLFPPGTGLIGSLVREEGHIYSLTACGDLLYTGSDSKNIRVWKNQKDYSGFKSTSGLVKAIVISADRRIFTGHQDGKIRVWRVSPKNPKIHKRIGTLPRLKDFLKSSMNPSNYVESRRGKQKSAVWIRHSDAISTLSLSEDQTLLYSGSWDRTLKVWRLADSKCLESVSAHDDAVNAVVNGFDSLVFTGSADGTVKVWKREPAASPKGATRHAEVQTLLKQESAVTALAINRSTGVVYSGSSDGVVNLWERGLSHGGVLHGHKLAVLCLASAGSLLFSGSADKTICLWGRESGGAHVCLSVLTGHGGPVKCLAVEADPSTGGGGGRDHDAVVAGKMWLLYSGSLDKSVKVWKVCDAGDQASQQQQQRSDESSSVPSPPKFDMY